jgi:hypothetical protein
MTPNSNYEIITSKINDLDTHFNDMVSQTDNKFKIIKENIKALSNYFEEEKLKEEHRLEKKMNYIKVFEKKINERFDEERAKREEIECRVFNLINNKFNILFNELNNECHNRISCVENLQLYLDAQNKDNPDLKNSLNKEKNSRIDNDSEINEKITQEINNMENIIQDQKKTREQSEQSMLDTLKGMINKTKIDLKKEKKNRKNAEENILSLIEDTITKINELDDYDNIPDEDEE